MKLKKLLAAVTAAALAVTTVAVTSFTASAATPIYSVTLEASVEKTYSIPIAGVDMSAVSMVDVTFKSTMSSMNGGGGYNDANGWVPASSFSCDVPEGQAENTTVWSLNVSTKKPTGDIQAQIYYMSGAGKIDITSVDFKAADGSVVKTLNSPYSIEVARKETGSTSVTPVSGIDYTKTAKIEVDIASSTAKGTNGTVGVNKDSVGGWKSAGQIDKADSTAAWEDTWVLTGLDGCDPASLQVQFWAVDVDQVLSVTAIRFYDADGNELTEGGDEGKFEITVNPGEKTIAVDEDFTVTVLVTGTTPELQNVDGSMQASYDAAIVSVDDGTDTKDGMVYTITGVAAGTTTVDFEWTPEGYELETPLIVSCDVTVTDGTTPPAVAVTVSPSTATIKVGETTKLTAAVTGKDDAVVTWEANKDQAGDDVVTVAADGTVTGKKAGTVEVWALVDGERIDSNTSFSVVTVETDEGGDTPSGSITVSKDADGTFPLPNEVLALLENKNTQIVVEYNSPKGWEDIGFGFSGEDWISASLPAKTGSNTDTFTVAQIIEKAGVESLAGVTYGKVEGYNGTEIISVTVIPGKSDSGNDDDNKDDDRVYALLWEGTKNMPTDWSSNVQIDISEDILSKIKAGDKIVATLTPADGAQIALKYNTTGWPALPGFAAANSGHDYSDPISGTVYTHTVTAEDIEALRLGLIVSGHDYTLTKVELNPDKKPGGSEDPDHEHTIATAWSSNEIGHWHTCSGCDAMFGYASHTSDSGTVTTPATETTTGTRTYKCTVCEYVIRTETIPATGTGNNPAPWNPAPEILAPVIPTTGVNVGNAPSVNGINGWEAVSIEIKSASDGDKVVVEMNGTTKVPSTVLGDIEGKDIDVVFNMGRGITWTVNGLSITSRKTIDLDVTKNTRHIPDEVVEKAEGSHKKQFSLSHKGTFGCTAALTYDVGTKYNGLYANLFYYNPKTEQLEFADCSLISGGKAKFMFTHASDYLITISEEPLGEFEDVSSAAGIASDGGVIGTGAALSSVLAVTVLGFGIVIYRKRRHN